MACWRCFLPMYPLGHNVSEISSTGMMRGEELLVLVVVVVVANRRTFTTNYNSYVVVLIPVVSVSILMVLGLQ